MKGPGQRSPQESLLRTIFLSSPHTGGDELRFVREVLGSNYIAPLGPQADAFEREFCDTVGIPYAAAISTGTAALHLALRLVGVGAGDEMRFVQGAFGNPCIDPLGDVPITMGERVSAVS